MFRYILFYLWMVAAMHSAPDFPQYRFQSSLPKEVKWELKEQVDKSATGIVVQNYWNDTMDRAIALILDKNRTGKRNIDEFWPEFREGVLRKPNTKALSDRERIIGGLPGRVLSVQTKPRREVRTELYAVTVTSDSVYIIRLTSLTQDVERDPMLTAFLDSIVISKN